MKYMLLIYGSEANAVKGPPDMATIKEYVAVADSLRASGQYLAATAAVRLTRS